MLGLSDSHKAHIARTDSKLRYARIFLDELRQYGNRSSADDFETGHQEAFLYHLLGALDSFLQELNICYRCAIPIDQVTRSRLRTELEKKDVSSPELAEISDLEKREDSWLGLAKEMRDHSTHRQRIARIFYEGGPLSGQVRLKHPKSQKPSDEDWLAQFETWYKNMVELISRLRNQML